MLARIPFWGWLMIIMMACYLVYNPLGFSVWHMWMVGDPFQALPFKLLATLLLTVLLGLMLHGTFSSTSWLGLLVIVALVGVFIWSVHALIAFDVFAWAFWSWALQPIVAFMLTLGSQWPKIWRRSTGAVSVNDPDTPA